MSLTLSARYFIDPSSAFTDRRRRRIVRLATAFVATGLVSLASATTAKAAQSIEHVITYGQSVASGWMALPVLSTVQPQNSLMFNSGIRTVYGVMPDRSILYSSFVPLVEKAEGNAGETPTAGTLEMVNDLKFSENGVSYANSPTQYLGSDPAVGGYSLAQLNYGTIPFYAVTEGIWYGATQARKLGVPYRVGAMTWTQGENDYWLGTSRQAYAAGMRTLHAWLDVYANAFTGQTGTVPIIEHQVSSHIATGVAYPSIALAQTDLASSTAGFYVATPSYMMDFVDPFHMTAASSKWLGAYFGVVYKRVVVDHGTWKPLEPTSATANGTSVVVKFNVPKPPLVFDTQQVVNPGNYGFTVVTSTGINIPIASISITAPDTVTIVTRQFISAGTKVRYAFKGTIATGRLAGPRGNLRDSQGNTLVFEPTGINKRMDNWCVIFERTVGAVG